MEESEQFICKLTGKECINFDKDAKLPKCGFNGTICNIASRAIIEHFERKYIGFNGEGKFKRVEISTPEDSTDKFAGPELRVDETLVVFVEKGELTEDSTE